MDRSFVEALVERTQFKRPHVVDGSMYVPDDWSREGPRIPEMLRSSTLTSIRDFVKAETPDIKEDTLIIHAVSPSQVTLMSLIASEVIDWQRRRTAYLTAECYAGPVFGHWDQPEDFIIWLLANFADSGDRDGLLELVSSMKSENVREDTDGGYAQEVVVRSGIASVAAQKVENPIKLQPFRTFPEIAQPESDFIVRFKSRDGQRPSIALFETTSGQWQARALQSIKAWLEREIPEVLVIA